MLYGAIIEGVATLLCRLTSKYLGDLEPKYAAAIDSFIATSLGNVSSKMSIVTILGQWSQAF